MKNNPSSYYYERFYFGFSILSLLSLLFGVVVKKRHQGIKATKPLFLNKGIFAFVIGASFSRSFTCDSLCHLVSHHLLTSISVSQVI